MLRRPLLLAAVLLAASAPAEAQRRGEIPPWLSSEWYISDYKDKIPDQYGVETWLSSHMAGLSIWLRDLGFTPPRLKAENTQVDGTGPFAVRYKSWIMATDPERCDANTLAQYIDSNNPRIEICSGTLLGNLPLLSALGAPASWSDTDLELISTFAHELFHGVHEGYEKDAVDGDAFKWITEGTAEAVGHAWKATIKPEFGWWHEVASTQFGPDYTRSLPDPSDANAYGLGHFWWNLGQLLVPVESTGITIYQDTFWNQPWSGDGVANVDAALRAIAAELDAPPNAREGLYDLYPQVIAHATDPTHFGHIETTTLVQPAISPVDASIAPLSTHAYRFHIDIDETQTDAETVPVRFTLNGLDAASRDALHLIVDTDIAGRPRLDTTPYSHIVHTHRDTTLEVRIANVAPRAERSTELFYTLRVEVEGFTGTADGGSPAPPAGGGPASPLAGGASPNKAGGGGPDGPEIAGDLRPGFSIRGPGAWTCSGSRAVFDLASPDERAGDLERLLPEMSQDMENSVSGVEAAMRRMERAGHERALTPEQVRQMQEMNQTVAGLLDQAAEQADAGGEADAVRAESRALLRATFLDDASDCQMLLNAALHTREGGPGILPGVSDASLYPDDTDDGPRFEIGVLDREMLQMVRGERLPADRGRGWEVCMMSPEEAAQRRRNAGGCPAVTCTPGELNLERASDGQITGTFEFEVLKWPATPPQTGCHVPEGRDVVTGQFNVASGDDGQDDNALSLQAGAPILE